MPRDTIRSSHFCQDLTVSALTASEFALISAKLSALKDSGTAMRYMLPKCDLRCRYFPAIRVPFSNQAGTCTS